MILYILLGERGDVLYKKKVQVEFSTELFLDFNRKKESAQNKPHKKFNILIIESNEKI